MIRLVVAYNIDAYTHSQLIPLTAGWADVTAIQLVASSTLAVCSRH